MLNPSKSKRNLLRILAYLLFVVAGSMFVIHIYRFLVMGDPPSLFYVGSVVAVFPFLGLAIVSLCLGLERPRLLYVSLFIGLWLLGIALWYQQSHMFSTSVTGFLFTPENPWPYLFLPLIGTLLLLALYKPIMRKISRFVAS